MNNNRDSAYYDDMRYIAENAPNALNIFCKIALKGNQLVFMYGDGEYLSLQASLYESKNNWGKLRLRTREKEGSWENVPVGFHIINDSKGLFKDMRIAMGGSIRKNSFWYVIDQLKDIVGDCIESVDMQKNKNIICHNITFSNGYKICVGEKGNKKSQYIPCANRRSFVFLDPSRTQPTPKMTPDECILTLSNIAMQEDKRIAQFISIAKQYNGNVNKAIVSRENKCEVSFPNNYLIAIEIEKENIKALVYGIFNNERYLIEAYECPDMSFAQECLEKASKVPIFTI